MREIEDARGNTTDYDYTYYGVERITNARGHSVEYEYDSKGNRTAVRDTMTNKEINYSYDQWDNLQTVTDPLGNRTNYYYNKEEQITMVRDSKDNTISYQYNEYNTVGQIRYTNPLGLNYTYQYDRYGRLTEEYDQSNNNISYEYYPDGSIKKATDSMGNETEYTYEDGRIVQSERNGVVTEYHYDSEGRVDYLTQGENPNAQRIEFEYNVLDQVTAVRDSLGRRIEYTYDEVGNIETMTAPGEGTFEYTYDNLNQVKTITTPANETYTYSYDAAGRRTGLIYPNGKEISYSYDEFGRMETYDNGIETYTYSYDNMNITEIETAEGAISYEYDELDRLTGVFYPDGESVEYEYDTAGNRTSKTVIEIVGGKPETERITYSYDFSNRMTRAGDVRYEYDEKDRLVKKIDGDDTFRYSYNSLDQLISVTKNGAEVASFAYDLQGRRISETINGEEKEYLWSGDSLLGEYSGNSIDRLYAVGNGVDEVLGIYDDSGETQYLHSNHVGSIIGVTSTDGSIAGEKEYTPFGLARETSGEVNTELGFIGRKQYEEIGLTYIRARFYEPAAGRFITKDPVRDGFNWYSYCGANPLNQIDRNGNSATVCGLIIGGVSGGIFSLFDEDKSVWEGIISGSTSGAITGAAIDITIASGGTSILVFMAAGAVGGSIGGASGEIAGQVYDLKWQKQQKVSGNIDWNKVGQSTISGGISGLISGGTAGHINAKYLQAQSEYVKLMSNSASAPEMVLKDVAKRGGAYLIDSYNYSNTLDLQTSLLYSISSNYIDYISE